MSIGIVVPVSIITDLSPLFITNIFIGNLNNNENPVAIIMKKK